MEIILTILLFLVAIGYSKNQEAKTYNYLNSHAGNIDYGKMNDDRIMNNLSNSQVNQNILNGKYNR